MRIEDNYDWLVLGNHPGALLTACMAAKLGLSVLILPLGLHLGRLRSYSGQYFDPESNFILGLGKSGEEQGLVLKCLTQLGLIPSYLFDVDINLGLPQVLTEESRFVLARADQLSSELYREYGEGLVQKWGLIKSLSYTEGEFLNYWQNLPKRLTLNAERKSPSEDPMTLSDLRNRLAKVLRSRDTSLLNWISNKIKISEIAHLLKKEDLQAAVQGLLYGVTGSVSRDPSLFDILHIFNLSRVGASFRGGLSNYREFLLNSTKNLGAQIPAKAECRRIFVDQGRLIGVQVSNRGSMISVGGGIIGCSLRSAYDRMTYTGNHFFRRKKLPLLPMGWRFTLAMTVRKESIPRGMSRRSFWKEKDAPVLEIEIVDSKDYELEDSENFIIYLRTLMPYSSESLHFQYQRVIAGRMLRKTVEILPFLEYHIVSIYPDFRFGPGVESFLGALRTSGFQSESKKNDLMQLYNFTTLNEIPQNLLVYSGEGVGSSSGIDGLFVSSDESYPDLGTLGPTVAAFEAVAWLAHRSGFAGPMI